MTFELAVAAVVSLLVSAVLTGVMRRLAVPLALIDLPNIRSSHHKPTPRGGGAAVVITLLAAVLIAFARGTLSLDVCMALMGGGAAIALIGFLDDRRAQSAKLRIVIHVAAAAWALAWIGGLPALQVGASTVSLGWLGYGLGVLAIVWVLNLFNFMDGIDGIAGSEAAFIAIAAVLLACTGSQSGLAFVTIVLGAACLGFLAWNWPPAKIFMGDVGSGFIGYTIAVLAVAAARDNPIAIWVWLILGAVFFVDATVTFFRRIVRREHVYVAHRNHAYQKLARRWQSHRRVTCVVLSINLLWILPCAWIASRYPHLAAWMLLVSMAPVVVGVILARAGVPDAPSQPG